MGGTRDSRFAGRLALGCAIVAGATSFAAAQPTPVQQSAIRQSCRSDFISHCSGVTPGSSAALACLQQNAAQLSPACQQALRAASGAAAAKAAPAAAQPSASAQLRALSPQSTWPHTVTTDRGTAVVYQPQAISWPDRSTLNARIALGITPIGAKSATLGTIQVAFTTYSDLAARTVTLTSPKLTSITFPTATPEQQQRFEQGIKNALETMGDKRVPLDTILLSLNQEAEAPPPSAVKNDAPAIYYSSRPASLLIFDGEPVLAPVAGTSLSTAVNTNWDVFFDPATKTWYWLNNGAWLMAADFKGPWSPVTTLPPAFSSLPSDSNFAAVRKQVPGRRITAAEMPTIFVSTLPAAVIVTQGTPKLVAIPGTSLNYVSNTDANLFVDSSTAKYYYLLAGRWFSSSSLGGPWTFATTSLPADFARIPPDSPRGSVLSSVPRTPQAQEALLQSQVPTQATLDRATTKVDVVYSGEPKFEPIAGTGMTYAVNTMNDVIKVGDNYYLCYQAAWFVAPTPGGPWTLADSVPIVIYTIPPSSPLYRVTFVRIYGGTATTVTYGYTSGYTMTYVSDGVVVYGTGYYYPPVIWPAPVPIYYPYPYTWSASTWYNPNTGAWARGGTIYGPYGGAVSGGTAYNPNTGAWIHGGAVYGPNGGAGAWSGYNPSTGGYIHGSASWGTNSGTANANWYNGRTGITGSTNQNYNQYGSWGSSTFSGQNKTVTTQHQSNAQGTAGSFQSSTGAEGAAVRGAGGNTAGVVKGAGGNVYAGANGNVYQHTSSGWSKWDDGSWNPVQPPTNQSRQPTTSGQTRQSGASPGSLSGETQRGSAFSQRPGGEGGEFQQLDRDRFARTQGFERQQRAGGGFAGAGRARR